MVDENSYPLTLYADQEHERLRTAVVFLLFFLTLIIFIVSRVTYGSVSGTIASYSFALSCITSLALALAVAWAAERYLKTIWRSGDSVTITADSIVVASNNQPDIIVSCQVKLVRFDYYFHLKNPTRTGRERRVSGDAVCLASEVVQGNEQFILYAYMPSKVEAKWMDPFRELNPNLIDDKGEQKAFVRTRAVPVELLRGKDGRYWLAEQHRWKTGMELTAEDFEIFMEESSVVAK